MKQLSDELYDEVLDAMQYLMLEIGDKYDVLNAEGFHSLAYMKLIDDWDYRKAGAIFIKLRDLEDDKNAVP